MGFLYEKLPPKSPTGPMVRLQVLVGRRERKTGEKSLLAEKKGGRQTKKGPLPAGARKRGRHAEKANDNNRCCESEEKRGGSPTAGKEVVVSN